MEVSVDVSVLMEKLRDWITGEAAISGGEEMVRYIEDELEWLNLVFANIHGFLPSNRAESIQQVMVRAQDLVNTFPRTVSQINAVSIHKKPNYIWKLRKMIKELRRVQRLIAAAKYDLSRFMHNQPFQLPLSLPPEDDGDVPSLNFLFYFFLFPAGFEIPARRLIALWIAEGLVQPKKYDSESVEDIGTRYLTELIRRDLVSVTQRKRNGKVKTCKLKDDDDIREKWLPKARQKNFLPENADQVRRLVDSNSTIDAGPSFFRILGNHSIYHDVPRYRDITSFLSFDIQQGRRERDDIGYFINKCISAGCFKWLKVLDLERVFRPVLPKSIGSLILLKYLGLRWTYLKDLPEFVKGLLNLEVIDVKHTYITILPPSIWRMQYLRHLYLSEAFRTRFPRPISTISLASLQTLWGAFIDEDTCVERGLDTLRSIRKLGLSCRSRQSESKMAEQMKAIAKWISNLKFLESLRLKSRDVNGKPDDLHLTSLERNTNLSTVYLLGKLDPLVVCEFPASLTDITLSGSELDLDPLEFLARLPNLQSLRLLGLSVKHTRIRCSRRGFPLLKVLCMWKLEKLEELEVERGSVPCLEELEIRSCHNLQSLPDALPHIITLKKFELDGMPDAFIHQFQALLEDINHVVQSNQD